MSNCILRLLKRLPSYVDGVINDHSLYIFDNKLYYIVQGGIDGQVDLVRGLQMSPVIEQELEYPDIEFIPIMELEVPNLNDLFKVVKKLKNYDPDDTTPVTKKRLEICQYHYDLFYCSLYLTEGTWLLENGVLFEESTLFQIESINSRENKITVVDLVTGYLTELYCTSLRTPSLMEIDMIVEELIPSRPENELKKCAEDMKALIASFLDSGEREGINFDPEPEKRNQIEMNFGGSESTIKEVVENVKVYNFDNFKKPKRFSDSRKSIKSDIKQFVCEKKNFGNNGWSY